MKERFHKMESKEDKERYVVHKPNPKNKKAKTWIFDQQKQEYLNAEEALAKILNILDQKN